MRLARDHARPRRPRLHPRGRSARPQRALAVDPAGQGSAFAPIPGVDLDEILCVQEERQVMNGNCVSYRTLKLQIPESPVRLHFVKARVKVHVDPDGSHALFHRPRCIGRYDEKGRLKDDGPRPARRLTPLGGAPVEMGTTLPRRPQSHRETKPEEADKPRATKTGQLNSLLTVTVVAESRIYRKRNVPHFLGGLPSVSGACLQSSPSTTLAD
jgi:hypothetical protein